MAKKVIAWGYAWTCENMDFLAPITEEFIVALFDDGTRDRWNGEELCTEAEVKEYAHKDGYVFKGDAVVIVSGRKMLGEVKTVKDFFRYQVAGTYGHKYTDYIRFTDGTKVQQKHCRVLGYENVEWCKGEYTGYYIGGRL